MKKRLLSLLLVLCMVLSFIPTTAFAVEENGQTPSISNPFTDVREGDWCYDAVQYARMNGFFNGTSKTTFTPNGTMTRGMFVTVLGRMAGVDTELYEDEKPFSDVPSHMYYAPYVAWASKHGITTGTGEGKFSPDALINRQQMATFFVRYFETFGVDYETGANITTVPADMASVAPYAKDAVQKLWNQGLLNGDGKNFNPAGNATRAQAATLCMRTDEAVEVWYREPGVPSDRVKIDPVTGETVTPEAPSRPSGGSSSGSSSTRYYKVTYVVPNGVSVPEETVFPHGTKLTDLPSPYKRNTIFLGWHFDAELNERVTENDRLNKDITLYAKMAENVTPLSEGGSPNYVSSIDQESDFVIWLSSGATMADIKVTDISSSNKNITDTVTVSNGNVSGDWVAGHTYQLEVLNPDVLIYYNNTVQDPIVRLYNFTIRKETTENLQLAKGIIYLPAITVTGLGGDANGLYKVDAKTRNTSANNVTGTFTYVGGEDIEPGDTVAVYEGTRPDLRRAKGTDNGDVAYLQIIAINGSTYTYKVAEAEDVMFMPDVLPISSSADTDGDPANNSVTVSNSVLDFSDDQYAQYGLDSQTVVEKGDYIVIYQGTFESQSQSEPVYGEITKVISDSETTTLQYTVVDDTDEILASMDLYHTREESIDLDREQIRMLEENIRLQAWESGFVDEAADYLVDLALKTDGFRELAEGIEVTNLSVTGLDEGDDLSLMAGSDKVEVEKNIEPNITTELDHFKDDDDNPMSGLRAELKMELNIEITPKEGSKNKIVIEMEAIFQQEILLNLNVGGGAIWEWAWIIPYVADYQMNANFDIGTYTGIEITATAKTDNGEEKDDDDEDKDDDKDDDDDSFDWKSILGDEDGETMNEVVSIGKQIKELMEEDGKFFGEDVDGEDGEEEEEEGDDGLAGKYAEMIKNAEDTWIELVRQELFKETGYVDQYGILNYTISGDLVISANLYVTLGMSFEFEAHKRYAFSLLLFAKEATSETIDVAEPHYEFVFYVMGTLGIRAGVEFEIAMGLISTELNSIGITAEAGVYAQLWGYFYYELTWSLSEGKDSTASGAMFVDIGIYLTVKFKAQLLNNDKLTYNPTLYENQWSLWSIGEEENVFDFAYEEDDESLTQEIVAVRSLQLPTSLFDMKYMNMTDGKIYGEKDNDGEWKEDDEGEKLAAKNFDSTEVTPGSDDEKRFVIELSNPKFKYDPTSNTITLDPGSSVIESCDVTIIWSGAPLAFSSKAISRTVTINWSDPQNVRYIQFNSMGGSSVRMLAGAAGQSITWPTDPTKQGYVFGGWYTNEACTSAYTGSKANLPETSIGLYAKWDPAQNTAYRVEHYTQVLGNSNYELKETQYMNNGVTDSAVTVNATSYTGFTPVAESATGTVLPDGSLVLKLYYNRNKYDLVFMRDSNDANPVKFNLFYGANVSVPVVSRPGYTFAGWNGTTPTTMPASNMTFVAQWTANLDTPYRVEHYEQTQDGKGYLMSMAENKTGRTDSNVSVTELIRTGLTGLKYTEKATVNGETVSSAAIAADGSLVVKLYYNRLGYTVSYSTGEGSAVDPAEDILFGAEVPLPETDPTREGYTFGGWYKDEACETLFNATSDRMPAENLMLYARWIAGTDTPFTVEHYLENLDGTSFSKHTEDTTQKGTTGATGIAEPVTIEGFTYDSENSANIKEGVIAADGSLVLKLYYSRNSHTVTWTDYENDTVTTTDVKYGAEIPAPENGSYTTPVRTGYTHAGWVIPEGTMPDEPITVSAQWEPITYKVIFHSNYGTDETVEQTVVYDQTVALEANTFSNAGYSFGGWMDAAEGTVVYQNQASISNLKTQQDEEVHLYAKWNPGEGTAYTVVHWQQTVNQTDYEEVSGSRQTLTGITEETTTAVANSYPGFAAQEIEQQKIVGDGTTVVNIYYDRNSYTIYLDEQGGDRVDDLNVLYGSNYGDIPEPEQEGYTFKGWYTETNGGGSEVTSDTVVTITADQTLYACWERAKYDVTFDSNGGSAVDAQIVEYGNKVVSPDDPTRIGYSFGGWYIDSALITKYDFAQPVTGDMDLYAAWTANVYTVSFYADPGSVSPDSKTVIYGEQYGTLPDPILSGHTFEGWYTGANGTGTKVESNTVFSIADSQELYAKWQIVTYSVDYNLKGGSLTGNNPETYQVTTPDFALSNPTLTGYIFDGWTGSNGDIPEINVTVDTAAAKNLEYEANWTPISYSIRYHGNATGFTGSMQEQNLHYEEVQEIFENGFSYIGYTFAGWNTKPDGSGEEYKPGDKVENLTTSHDDVINLYAQWSLNSYEVQFLDYDGTVLKSGMVNHFDPAIAPENPGRTGYTFAGWDKAFGEITGPLTVTATYTANTYSFKLSHDRDFSATGDGNNNASLNGETSGSLTYGETYTITATPAGNFLYDGFTLNGTRYGSSVTSFKMDQTETVEIVVHFKRTTHCVQTSWYKVKMVYWTKNNSAKKIDMTVHWKNGMSTNDSDSNLAAEPHSRTFNNPTYGTYPTGFSWSIGKPYSNTLNWEGTVYDLGNNSKLIMDGSDSSRVGSTTDINDSWTGAAFSGDTTMTVYGDNKGTMQLTTYGVNGAVIVGYTTSDDGVTYDSKTRLLTVDGSKFSDTTAVEIYAVDHNCEEQLVYTLTVEKA